MEVAESSTATEVFPSDPPPPTSPAFAHPGRPRNDLREQAILDAALGLVAEVGYERLTMDAIASRAKASKATIYRRWAGKQELVVDAMHCYVSDSLVEPEDTGSLRGDLAALVRAMADSIRGFDGHLVLGLAQAALTSPGLSAALAEQAGAEKEHPPAVVVGRAVTRGELPPGADPLLLNEIAHAVVIMRLVNGQTLDEPFLDHLVDDILVPALRHPPTLSPTSAPGAPDPAAPRTAEPGVAQTPATQPSDLQNLTPPIPARSNEP